MLSFRWWFKGLFFVCADLLHWVPIFLRTVYSVQFCLHRCRSSPMPSYVFKMLSVDWYVRNRIQHVHPVLDGNSRCRLGAARHSTTSRVLPAQSASRVTVRHGMNVPDSLCPPWWRIPTTYTISVLKNDIDLLPSCQIILKFCTEHGSITAMLCANFKNDLTTEMLKNKIQEKNPLPYLWVCCRV